jgi:ATP-dependent helicase HrpB
MAASCDLPVALALPELRRALDVGTTALLSAPPGSGKTTLVPLALLDAPWLAGQSIVVLEPRRLAARKAAERMADLLGQRAGDTVGYTTRFDRKVGPATRIEVVTEGVLTRRLLADPALEGTGLIVFDEFHERSLEADLALVLCCEVRSALRPELRLLVMSATLETRGLAGALGEVPTIRAEGRLYPVEIVWLGSDAAPLDLRVAAAARRALAETPGDVLVFLPGMAEIRRAERQLLQRLDPARIEVHPLHGELPPARQQAALLPSATGRRKVVLASAVAETSLTIEGVTAVVDSGLARRAVWSPRTGMGRLVTVPAARANAEQRRGRAGRLAPGICYRLWSEALERGRPAQLPPEIADADLTPLALDLAAWGATDPMRLGWPTPPPAAALDRAQELLRQLGALDATGRVTAHGRDMARLPLHPRLAHMLLEARRLGFAATALAVAALLSGRDPWREDGPDLALRLSRMKSGGLPQELARTLRQLRRLAGSAGEPIEPERCGAALALAFPERIGQRRGSAGAFRLASGRGAVLDAGEPLAAENWLVAAELDDAGADARIRLAARLSAADLDRVSAGRLVERDEVVWDRRQQAVTARRLTMLDSLVLHERIVDDPDPAATADALVAGVRDLGPGALAWTREAAALRARIAFLHRHEPESWPVTDDAALLRAVRQWLELNPARRPAEIDVGAVLAGLLDHVSRRRLDAEAPTHATVPSGSRLPIDYGQDPPVLAVRLQEMLGSAATPTVRGGRTPLVLHLLSPAQRPIALTRDLAGFWATGYPAVRKELRGRYPRHVWPEDPLSAAATARAKPRR